MAKSTAYLLQYKNYYNKSLDRFDTLSDYMEYMCVGPQGNPINEVDFKPNDGVNATLTINWEGEHPDYVLVDTSGTISRWYVLESNRTRQGQYILTLYRDLLVDYYETITSSPMIVHKGFCGLADYAIYNDEPYTANQIKKREELLKDNTRCPWVVGYCSVPKDNENIPAISYGLYDTNYNYYTPTLEDWDYNEFTLGQKWISDVDFTIRFRKDDQGPTVKFDKDGNIISSTYYSGLSLAYGSYSFEGNANTWASDIVQPFKEYYDPQVYNAFLSANTLYSNEELKAEVMDLNNKVLKVGHKDYYKIEITNQQYKVDLANVDPNTVLGTAYTSIVKNIKAQHPNLIKGTANRANFMVEYTYDLILVALVSYTPVSGFTFPWPTNRRVLTDAPYCMFCLPYSNDFYVSEDGQTGYYTSKDNALSVASGIAKSLGSNLYDLQLLPYCPYSLVRNSQDQLDMGLTYINFASQVYEDLNTENHTDYITLPNANQIVLFCPTSTDTFTIGFDSYDDFNYASNVAKKAKVITEFYRLNSPNYNATYEFNPHKNNGVEYFKVDYAYKPYQPYIHVAPNWGGLYGKDFNDAKGLVCSGDFSLPVISDEWTNYVINNKNYENVFNAQIETNDYVRKWQRAQEITGMITGTAIGAGSGFGVGSMMSPGSKLGAIGAVAGGVASLAGGITDVIANQKIYNKQKQLTIDTFTLNNQNVQARPYALSKVGALNPNNKLFPFVEVFGTTDEEYITISTALGLNGFTLERIGFLENIITFKPSGVHGKITATIPYIYDLVEDSHIAFAINQELEEGVII